MNLNDGSGSSLEARDAEAILLKVEPGVAVLLGDHVPAGLEIEPFGLGSRGDREIVHALSNAVGAANLAAQGMGGLVSAQGLVRLAPETIRDLRTMQTVAEDNYYLGTLTRSGKFTASVRWAPATDAQMGVIMASLGPALALLTISVQLTAISSKVDENIKLTRDVLRALREDHWNTLGGLCDTIAGAIEEAREVGIVTSRTFDRVKHLEDSLRKERKTFAGYLGEHLQSLDSGYADRRDYLRDKTEDIIADVQGFVMAETAYYRYQTLRAAEIAADDHRSAGDDELMRHLARQIPTERRQSMERIVGVLEQLNAHCHLAAESSGRIWSPRDRRSRRSSGVDRAVNAMIEYVDRLRGAVYEEPLVLSPGIKVIKDDASNRALDILRWALPRDEPLLALAEVRGGIAKDSSVANVKEYFTGAAGYLGVTPTRFFLTSQSALTGDGSIERSIPLSDLRYVRLRMKNKGASLDIITRDENIATSFDDWAVDDAHAEEVSRVADLLMASVNLPEKERRNVPEIQGITSRGQMVVMEPSMAGHDGEY